MTLIIITILTTTTILTILTTIPISIAVALLSQVFTDATVTDCDVTGPSEVPASTYVSPSGTLSLPNRPFSRTFSDQHQRPANQGRSMPGPPGFLTISGIGKLLGDSCSIIQLDGF